MCCAFLVGSCTTMSISDAIKMSNKNGSTQNCEQLPVEILKRVHGPAFDARYMSVDQPPDDDESISDTMYNVGRKRKADNENFSQRPSFYITTDHTEVLSEEPAWNIEWDKYQAPNSPVTREKRSLPSRESLSRPNAPWHCERKVKWEHLGPDYHPSHLRTVECTQRKCYYQQYDCKPRYFTVRILKRRRGVCSDASKLKFYGFTGESAEVWEFVEVTVNFCCDCVASNRYF